jgi:hypothetical protein
MDIIITNQLIYLVAHHFTGLTTTFLRRRSMKPVKNFVFALLLVFAISVHASAGEMPIPPGPEPPPRATTTASDETTPSTSDPYSEQSGETIETSDYLLFEALKALLSLY